MHGPLKPLEWIGSAKHDYAAFPAAAQEDAGYQLYQVQTGELPPDFKPMPSVGGGVYEIRIHTGTEHRVFYIAKYAEAVYVLHAFEKRTRKTAARDIERGRARLAELVERRQRRGLSG